MLKRLKSVSMLLFLMGASTGAAYAVANPGVTDVKITQQTGTCTGVVVDATGETVIGASVVVKGPHQFLTWQKSFPANHLQLYYSISSYPSKVFIHGCCNIVRGCHTVLLVSPPAPLED